VDARSAPSDASAAPRGREPAFPAVLERALRTAYENGRRAHPALTMPFEAFVERAAKRSGSPEGAAALERAAHADLYLAIGCEVGTAGAWDSFCGAYRSRLEALLLARSMGRAESEAMAADLLADLALPPPRHGTRTLLGTYDGSGSLFAWLSVILARRRAAAAARRPLALSDARLAEASAVRAVAADPLDALLEGEAARGVRTAFERAWGGLSDRERLLLVFRHRHGVKQTDIAALLGIGAPRVSRLLDRAVGKLRRALGGLSAEGARFGGTPSVWESLRDAVGLHLARIDPARIEGLAAPPSKPAPPEDLDDS
jgi:RNA polymerase sigma factor (sigma-70 family)